MPSDVLPVPLKFAPQVRHESAGLPSLPSPRHGHRTGIRIGGTVQRRQRLTPATELRTRTGEAAEVAWPSDAVRDADHRKNRDTSQGGASFYRYVVHTPGWV